MELFFFSMAEAVFMWKFTSTGDRLSLQIPEAIMIDLYLSKGSNLIVCLDLLCCVYVHHFYHVDNYRWTNLKLKVYRF